MLLLFLPASADSFIIVLAYSQSKPNLSKKTQTWLKLVGQMFCREARLSKLLTDIANKEIYRLKSMRCALILLCASKGNPNDKAARIGIAREESLAPAELMAFCRLLCIWWAFWVIKFMTRPRPELCSTCSLRSAPLRQPQMLLKCLTFWPMSITVHSVLVASVQSAPHCLLLLLLFLLLRPVGLLISSAGRSERRLAWSSERRPMCTHVWACKNVMLICGLSRPAADCGQRTVGHANKCLAATHITCPDPHPHPRPWLCLMPRAVERGLGVKFASNGSFSDLWANLISAANKFLDTTICSACSPRLVAGRETWLKYFVYFIASNSN